MYFKKHAYSNTQTENLWKCFEDAIGNPFEQVMSTWTKKLHVIDISIASINDSYITINVSQKKFSLSAPDENDDSLWQVPITITTSSKLASKEHQYYILISKSAQITVEGVGANDWFKTNPEF